MSKDFDPLTFEDQATISQSLQGLARALDETLTRITGKRVPFSLMTWGGNRSQYVSNTKREDIKKAMTEILERWETGDDGPVHKAN